MITYRARQASGFGRTDWVVLGPCVCIKDFPEMFDEEEDGHVVSCHQCEDLGASVVFDGLIEWEAKDRADRLNKGTYKPFNPPQLRS